MNNWLIYCNNHPLFPVRLTNIIERTLLSSDYSKFTCVEFKLCGRIWIINLFCQSLTAIYRQPTTIEKFNRQPRKWSNFYRQPKCDPPAPIPIETLTEMRTRMYRRAMHMITLYLSSYTRNLFCVCYFLSWNFQHSKGDSRDRKKITHVDLCSVNDLFILTISQWIILQYYFKSIFASKEKGCL